MSIEQPILSLIADLYTQIQQLAAENAQLRAALEQGREEDDQAGKRGPATTTSPSREQFTEGA